MAYNCVGCGGTLRQIRFSMIPKIWQLALQPTFVTCTNFLTFSDCTRNARESSPSVLKHENSINQSSKAITPAQVEQTRDPSYCYFLEHPVLRNQELTMHLMEQDGCHTEFGNHKP